MFESSVLKKLLTDTALKSYVTLYNAQPAIFSEAAPEDADMPYLIFRIVQSSTDTLAVQKFSLFFDYYDYNKSASNSRKAAERIEILLDRAELEHERFSCIRCFFEEGSPLEEEDPRAIHYNIQFMVRAGNLKAMEHGKMTVNLGMVYFKKYIWFHGCS
jgi:hypothetical protein